MPKKGGEDLDVTAIELWAETLVTKAEADTNESAMLWIADLKRTNPNYFDDRLSVYRKKVRDDFAKNGNALWTLHDSARKTLMKLKQKGIGMIILDECHHLLHHWGRVLTELKEFFDDPIVLGLTATPPDFSTVKEEDADRYSDFFGEIDYEVPIPALVRDSNLAPYQDLCYFVRPAEHEIEYISKVDQEFDEILAELEQPPAHENGVPRLQDWVYAQLTNKILPGGKSVTWETYAKRNETFSIAARIYLMNCNMDLPPDVPKYIGRSWGLSLITHLTLPTTLVV